VDTFQKDENEAGGVFDDINLEDKENTPILIKNFFDRNLKCNVKGTVDVTKVTGQFQFKLNN
jgi:hypothetical protein